MKFVDLMADFTSARPLRRKRWNPEHRLVFVPTALITAGPLEGRPLASLLVLDTGKSLSVWAPSTEDFFVHDWQVCS